MNLHEKAKQVYIFNNFIQHVYKQKAYSKYNEIIGNESKNYIGFHLTTLLNQTICFCADNLIASFPFSKAEQAQLFFTQNPDDKLSIPEYAGLGTRYESEVVLGIFGTNEDPKKSQKQEMLEKFNEEASYDFIVDRYEENSTDTYSELIIAKPKVLTYKKTVQI